MARRQWASKLRAARALAVVALVPLALAACAGMPETAGTHEATVSGQMTYRQRIALPPDAVAQVRLIDRANEQLLDEQVIETNGRQVPIDFNLHYTQPAPSQQQDYELVATIRDAAGQLLWAAQTPLAATKGTQTQVFIRLEQAVSDVDELIGTTWQLERILRADDTWLHADANETDSIRFADDGRVSGKAGCNSYFGGYEVVDTNELKFSQMGATLMACPNASLADTFMKMLGQVDSFAVAGQQLYLFADDGAMLVFHHAESETQ